MICCAFGGIVVLYAVAPRQNAVGLPFRDSIEIAVEAAAGAAFQVGLAFPLDGQRASCWVGPCGAVPGLTAAWLRTPGELRALVAGTAALPEDVRVAIVGGPDLLSQLCVSA